MPTTTRRPKRRSHSKRPAKKLRMTTPDPDESLIEQIDLRQNELLDQLSDLNGRVESLLKEWTQSRDDERVDQAEAASPSGPSAPTFQSPVTDAAQQEC